jgi:hypothetical protein
MRLSFARPWSMASRSFDCFRRNGCIEANRLPHKKYLHNSASFRSNIELEFRAEGIPSEAELNLWIRVI